MSLKLKSSLLQKPKRMGIFGSLVHLIESKPAGDRLLLRVLFFMFIGSLLITAVTISNSYSSSAPVAGGTLKEGVIGIPRFVNPVLAVTRADQDMTALLYRGLMKIDTNGTLIPDLAESVTVSEDGRTYNVVIRKNIRFHDETPFTARDVAFTIGLLQSADLKSPLRGNWVGVIVEEISEYELNIVLEEAYTPFIENFTIGILPRHIWSELPIEQIPFSQRNTDPIGTGPFMMKRIIRNDSGLIDVYILERFTQAPTIANLSEIEVYFYQNEETLLAALNKGTISSTVYAPIETVSEFAAGNTHTIISEPLPRVFGIFFNQNRSAALRDSGARRALAAAVANTPLVTDILGGYGVPINGPMPSPFGTLELNSESIATTTDAEAILRSSGWSKNQNSLWEKRIDGDTIALEVTIRTANNKLFEDTAQAVARSWRAIGVEVQVEQYEQSDLLQSVIRPRDFQALLFGLDMSRAIDLYPFWHSSQREDPGLNISQYANIEVDSLLQKARTSQDQEQTATTIAKAVNIITRENPAVFLFTPALTYIVPTNLIAGDIQKISKPHERFMNIENWYMETDTVWNIFK